MTVLWRPFSLRWISSPKYDVHIEYKSDLPWFRRLLIFLTTFILDPQINDKHYIEITAFQDRVEGISLVNADGGWGDFRAERLKSFLLSMGCQWGGGGRDIGAERQNKLFYLVWMSYWRTEWRPGRFFYLHPFCPRIHAKGNGGNCRALREKLKLKMLHEWQSLVEF